MNSLPVWLQIGLSIFGVGNIIAIITLVMNNRQKDQALKDAKLQRLNDNLLQNTRSHIEPLYIPIYRLLTKLEDKYYAYKIAESECLRYAVKKGLGLTGESEASQELELLIYSGKHQAIIVFTTTTAELIAFLEKMAQEGLNMYLTADFEERLASFIRFLHAVINVGNSGIYMSEKEFAETPKIHKLGTPEFEKELYTEIDYIRAYIRELALGTTDAIKAPSKKL